ncbi:MAG: MBOAT family protein [Bacteroidia bacterium]
MLFNSIDFALFLPVVVAVYYALPHRFRWMLLLAASYYFYACWRAEYLLLVIFSTLVDYWAGLQMARRETKAARRPFLILSLVTNLGLLFTFKYLDFFTGSLNMAFQAFNIFGELPLFHLLLPVGISFYTFQTLSYSIEVYQGKQQAERHLGIFALYVSFFPQLVAGPIERASTLIHQLYERRDFDYERFSSGIKLMIWGFFKKIIIGDGLGLFVNAAYGQPQEHDSLSLLFASVCFAFQIYGDFSGYTDIARGTSRLMGFELMENFRQPYLSRSISDFWRRWHISLSTWFRDYVYIPLGGNRVVKWRMYYNLFITFTISGLWHGASWTFVIWGALHGFYLMFALATGKIQARFWEVTGIARVPGLHRVLDTAIVFVLVLIGWVFFRAATVQDAFYILSQILNPATYTATFSLVEKVQIISPFTIATSMFCMLLFLVLDTRSLDREFPAFLNAMPRGLRWGLMYLLLFCLVFFTPKVTGQFIYFQF